MTEMVCDFCLAERDELWGFGVGQFTERVYGITNIQGEWAVCDECRDVLEARNLPLLLDRVTRPGVLRDLTERFYSLLVLNITGPIVKCTDSDTPLYREEATR